MTSPQVRRAIVIAVGRNAAWVVRDGEREPVLAALRKTLARTVLAPGDTVTIRALDDDRVVIDQVEPRSFALIRRTAGGRTKTMAANIETMAIVVALADPPPSLAMLDQLIAFAVQHEVEAALILTKADLAEAGAVDAMRAIYRPADVPVLVVQPKAGDGIGELAAYLTGRHALLVGNSGSARAASSGPWGARPRSVTSRGSDAGVRRRPRRGSSRRREASSSTARESGNSSSTRCPRRNSPISSSRCANRPRTAGLTTAGTFTNPTVPSAQPWSRAALPPAAMPATGPLLLLSS